MPILFKRPKSNSKLLAAVEGLIDGARGNAGILAIPADFETALATDRDALVVAMNQYAAKRGAEAQLRNARAVVDAQADAFLTLLVQVLRPRIGPRRNPEWSNLALPARSFARPADSGARRIRLEAARLYLLADPTREVPTLNVTAAQASVLLGQLADSGEALQKAVSETRKAREAQSHAAEQLLARGRGSAETLAVYLAPDDGRWNSFGLRRPVDISRPEVPPKPTVVQAGPGMLEITIERPSRARRARIFLQRPDQQEPQVVATTRDWKTVLRNIAPGVVKVTVSAANGSGESPQSLPTSITVM